MDIMECPIAMTRMTNPVVAENGLTYEECYIKEWLAGNRECPISRKYMGSSLVKNHKVKNIIDALSEADGSVLYKTMEEATKEYDEMGSFNPAPLKTSIECSIQTELMVREIDVQTEHMVKDATVQTDPIVKPKVVRVSTTYQHKTVVVPASNLVKDQLSDAQRKLSNLTRTVQILQAENKKFNRLVYKADYAFGEVQSENQRLKMEISRLNAYSNAHYMAHQIRDMSAELFRLEAENAKLKAKLAGQEPEHPASRARPATSLPRGARYAR